MKNYLVKIIAISFFFFLTACGGGGSSNTSVGNNGTVDNGGSVDTGGNGNNGGNNGGNTNPPPPTTPTWQSTITESQMVKDGNVSYAIGIQNGGISMVKHDSTGAYVSSTTIFTGANCKGMGIFTQASDDSVGIFFYQEDPVNPSTSYGNLYFAKVNKTSGAVQVTPVSVTADYSSQPQDVQRRQGENTYTILYIKKGGWYTVETRDLNGSAIGDPYYPGMISNYLSITADKIIIGGEKMHGGANNRVCVRVMNRDFTGAVDYEYNPPADPTRTNVADNIGGVVSNANGTFVSMRLVKDNVLDSEALLLKLDPSNTNNFSVTAHIPNPPYTISLMYNLATDADGNIYANTNGLSGSRMLVKLDPNGTVLFTKTLPISDSCTQLYPDNGYLHMLFGFDDTTSRYHYIYKESDMTKVF